MQKILLVLILLVFFACRQEVEQSKSKPNIVFIFADDMTYSAINALGNSEIQTPNLDQLVKQGTTFTHTYNMGGWNGAICAASRAMIISGRSLWNANAYRQRWKANDGFENSWGKLMESAGYETYMTGKWHVEAPADSIFSKVSNVRPGMPTDAWEHYKMVQKFENIKGTTIKPESFMPVGYNRPITKKDTTWSPTNKIFSGYWQGGKHWSEVLKDDALGFIENTKKSNKPFFMYLAFNAPHDPRQAPKEYVDKYDIENISVPKSFLPLYPFKDSIGNGPNLRDEALAPFPRTEYAIKIHTKEYYALITHLDEQIGQIVKGLKATGGMDNTYIIFTADHGLAMGKHGLIGKQSQFDHSVRAPFVIVGPKVAQNKKVDADIYLQDAMATSLDIAGVSKPEYVFFNSLLPFIKNEQTKSNYDAIYGAYIDLQRMLRKDGFKLIVYPKLDKILLFDMVKDPEEMNNLADDLNYKTKVEELFKALIQKQDELNDHLNLKPLYQQKVL